ncbi:TlpA disulfide reductase family protein [Arenibacter sp. GZD96]|uniref:TlpA disulfide reductase family protein n=1 Tax=Aurantibrevibacter litoralis TaxID=3106030 RepID=UPI002AFDD7E0|nr:TlpA disulfide reductase family protein [Arenibacter sp. GZD-96]MEA1785393.1 TlpA disulfide reductase family protein [Arenibacter sp. GZD-96]
MRKFVWILVLGVVLFACKSKPDGFEISATLTGELEDGTLVFLKKIGDNNQPVDVDTTTVQGNTFFFSGAADVPELHYIFIDKGLGYGTVIVEKGEINVQGHKDSLGLAKIEGTLQNDIFGDYLEQSREISARAMSINSDLQNANAARDTISIKSLRDEFFELQEEYKNFEIDYIKKHPNGLISALLLDRAFATKSLPENEISELFEALTPEIKATKVAKSIQERLGKTKDTSIGAVAPEFSAPTPEGAELALKEAMGKITIVDFWAAWCKPCRMENPNVVQVYNKYQDKGLRILGVSLDKNAADWHKAIADDGLAWQHVSNLAYYDDEIAKLYNVNAIPATFILDENGVIIAKDLRGPALEEKIAELLQ